MHNPLPMPSSHSSFWWWGWTRWEVVCTWLGSSCSHCSSLFGLFCPRRALFSGVAPCWWVHPLVGSLLEAQNRSMGRPPLEDHSPRFGGQGRSQSRSWSQNEYMACLLITWGEWCSNPPKPPNTDVNFCSTRPSRSQSWLPSPCCPHCRSTQNQLKFRTEWRRRSPQTHHLCLH